MKTRQWRDLTSRQRKLFTLGGAVQLLLLGAALLDLRRRSPEELRGSKRLWTPALFINFFGPIAYFLFGRKR